MHKKTVTKALITGYSVHKKALTELRKQKSLRELIIKKYSVFPSIYFADNSTSALINVLKLLIDIDENRTIYYSDLDHPCIINAIKIIWPGKRKVIGLYHFMLSGDIGSIERRLSEIKSDKAPIIVLSHVLWNSGLIIDVGKIANEIKIHHPNATIIIDGAQAIGNIQIDLGLNKKSKIDFYIGSLHKWAGCTVIVGFASINELWVKNNLPFYHRLFCCDRFSTFAGKIPYVKKINEAEPTFDLALLNKIVKELSCKKSRFDLSKTRFRLIDERVQTLPVPDYKFSAFVGYYAPKDILLDICKKKK